MTTRCVRALGLCLVAVFALVGFAAASASAELPEIYECHKLSKSKVTKKYEGRYEKGCVAENAKGEGEYELQPWNLAAKKDKAKEFKGKGGPANLEIVKLAGVECAKSEDKGKFTGPKTAGDIVVKFSGCKFEGKNCSNTATVGEIKTKPLVGVVGYLAGKGGPEPTMGVRLSPEAGEEYVEFSCSPLYFRVSDENAPGIGFSNNHGVIGAIVPSSKGGYPVNKFGKELALNFQQSSGVQKWMSFEGAGETDTLITQDQNSPFEGKGGSATKSQSAEQTLSTGKGEELELVA